MKVAVIGVYFNDQSYTYQGEEVQDVVFGTNNGVRNYFKNVSYGKIDIVPAEETSGVVKRRVCRVDSFRHGSPRR